MSRRSERLLRKITHLLDEIRDDDDENDDDDEDDDEEERAGHRHHEGHLAKLTWKVEELARSITKKTDEVLNVLREIERNTRR